VSDHFGLDISLCLRKTVEVHHSPPMAHDSYDEILYPTSIYPQTHINRLATIGVLRGLSPAPIGRCRVLEIGCGTGSNILPMAFNLPESHFIGLDLAKRPIATGQSIVAELRLQNIELHSMDLCEADIERFGTFDFIIAHGVYSWVPARVRDRLLALCRELLTPNGIAYISYNAYPGNHLRDLTRGIVRFHAERFEKPEDQIGQARGLIKFLSESKPKADAYRTVLKAEFDRILNYLDAAFYHDDLSLTNQPFYFHEFMKDARKHNLRYLGDAVPHVLDPEQYAPEVYRTVEALQEEDEIVREQYLDFIRGQGFRETLICRAEVELALGPESEQIVNLWVSCDAKPITSSESRATKFQKPSGAEIETAHPIVERALRHLCAMWPVAIPFEELLSHSTADDSGFQTVDESRSNLTTALLRGFHAMFVRLHVAAPKVVNVIGERPITSSLARYELDHSAITSNQLHVPYRFPDPLSRDLIRLLDGTRDRTDLEQALLEVVLSGKSDLIENETKITDRDEISAKIPRQVGESLQSLIREAMIVG
jgi:methyltransferase-like protein/trans-aconitate methyltransferase